MIRKQTLVAGIVVLFGVFGLSVLQSAPAAALNCAVLPQAICDQAENGTLQDSGTWKLLELVLQIMVAGVGIVAVGAIAYAGFLYATAGDSADQTKKAKDMIINTVIGVVAFGLMYVVLNFLIPGGVFL